MNPPSKLNPPTTLPPPPRRIRRRPTGRIGAIFFSLLFFGIALCGGYAAGEDLLRMLAADHGTAISTVITKKWVELHHGKHSTYETYWVKFNYTFAGHVRSSQEQIMPLAYNNLEVNQTLPGKAIQIGPIVVCVVTAESDHAGLIAGGIELVIFGTFTIILGAITIRKRRLVQLGSCASGEIIGRRFASAKNVRYYIRYRFTTSDGTTLENEMLTRRKYYDELAEGTVVTILYDGARPKRSVAYEGCDYEVQPMRE